VSGFFSLALIDINEAYLGVTAAGFQPKKKGKNVHDNSDCSL
jgi:hypothetical protein